MTDKPTQEPELKPCPFCGGEVWMLSITEECNIRCDTCQFHVGTLDDSSTNPSAASVKHWNTRPGEALAADAERERIAEKVGELGKFYSFEDRPATPAHPFDSSFYAPVDIQDIIRNLKAKT